MNEKMVIGRRVNGSTQDTTRYTRLELAGKGRELG
jgi:hypothetical protein